MNNKGLRATAAVSSRFHQKYLAQAMGLALASLALPALAQTDEPATLPAVKVEADAIDDYKAEKASSPVYTQPLVDTAKTITIVEEKVLKDQGVTSLRDALRNVSGITMQAGEGGVAAGDNLSIRGFDASNDLYVDGVRDIGAYSRDTFNLEQVEVTKGPSSTASGRGSAGGSVNVVSKTAKFEDFTRGSLKIGNEEQLRGAVDVNAAFSDSVAGRLNLMLEDSGVPGRDVVENKSTGVAGALTFKASKNTSIMGSLTYLDQDNMPDGGVPLLIAEDGSRYLDDEVAENFYGAENRDYDKNEILNAKLVIEHTFSDSLSLRNQTFVGTTETSAAFTRPNYSASTNDVSRGSPKGRDEERDIMTNQTTLRSDFSTGSVSHNLVGGLDFSREEYVNYALEYVNAGMPNVDLYHPVTDDPYNGSINRTGGKREGTYDAISLFASDTIKFSPAWQWDLGVRVEDYEQEYSQDYTASGRGGETPPFSYTTDDVLVSWNTSVVYKPSAAGSIYAGFATSQTPLGSNLTLSENQQNVDAEEDQIAEIGTKWELFEKRVLASAAIFRSVTTNAQTTDEDDLLVLDGEKEVEGLELGINGTITDNWAIIANYTYMSTEITKSGDIEEEGDELFNSPEHTANIWSTYYILPRLQVGGGVQYIGAYDNSTSLTLGSETLINLMASYQVLDNLSLQLNVNNLTDEKYLLKPRSSRGNPGAGRSVMLTANVEF